MSAKMMGLVWDLALEPILKYILMAYADHADHSGENIRPGVALIAAKTGYSVRQVQRLTGELVARGYLIPARYVNGGRGHVIEYRMEVSTSPWIKGDTYDTLSQMADTEDRLEQQRSRVAEEPEPQFSKGDMYDTLSAKGDTYDTLSVPAEQKGDTKGDTQDVKGDIAVSPQPSDPKANHPPSYLPPAGGEGENPAATPGGEEKSADAPGTTIDLPLDDPSRLLYGQLMSLLAQRTLETWVDEAGQWHQRLTPREAALQCQAWARHYPERPTLAHALLQAAQRFSTQGPAP